MPTGRWHITDFIISLSQFLQLTSKHARRRAAVMRGVAAATERVQKTQK